MLTVKACNIERDFLMESEWVDVEKYYAKNYAEFLKKIQTNNHCTMVYGQLPDDPGEGAYYIVSVRRADKDVVSHVFFDREIFVMNEHGCTIAVYR